MATEIDIPIQERILQLLNHLGIQQAHFGARVPRDWQGLVASNPETVASLTLLCPRQADKLSLSPVASRLLVITGDQGHDAETVKEGLAKASG